MEEYLKIKIEVMTAGCDEYDLAKIERTLIDAFNAAQALILAYEAGESAGLQAESRQAAGEEKN